MTKDHPEWTTDKSQPTSKSGTLQRFGTDEDGDQRVRWPLDFADAGG